MTIDMDSTICEVHGKAKHGAAYGYTRQLGYHPLVATRADTGEVLHARLRKGSSQRGHKRFVEELVARVRRGGATGALVLRADSGFWSWPLIDTLTRLGVNWSVTVAINATIREAIEGIDETEWTDIVYPDGGQAQVAGDHLCDRARRQATPSASRGSPDPSHRHRAATTVARLASPRVRHRPRRPDRRDRPVPPRPCPSRARDPRPQGAGAGLEHCPSGRFFANAAWLACAVLAHNLTRWTATLGDIHPDQQLTVTATDPHHRVFALPGRLVNRSGRLVLRLPQDWPWATTF